MGVLYSSRLVVFAAGGNSGVHDLLYPAVRRCDQGVCRGLADSSLSVDSSGDSSRADVMITIRNETFDLRKSSVISAAAAESVGRMVTD